jgi:hypothetical protein
VSKLILCTVALALACSASGTAAPQDRSAPGASASTPYCHGYYLFLSDPPHACEACYVPLLLSVALLEELAKDPAGQDADLITTYERDSIYQFNGLVHVSPGDIQSGPRTIRLRARNYRYQEITAAEILRLFENPMGTIPVSRPFLHSDLPSGPGLQELIAGFRAMK